MESSDQVKKDLPFDGIKPEDVFFAQSLGEGTHFYEKRLKRGWAEMTDAFLLDCRRIWKRQVRMAEE